MLVSAKPGFALLPEPGFAASEVAEPLDGVRGYAHRAGQERTEAALAGLVFLNERSANHGGSYFHSHLPPMSARVSATPENS